MLSVIIEFDPFEMIRWPTWQSGFYLLSHANCVCVVPDCSPLTREDRWTDKAKATRHTGMTNTQQSALLNKARREERRQKRLQPKEAGESKRSKVARTEGSESPERWWNGFCVPVWQKSPCLNAESWCWSYFLSDGRCRQQWRCVSLPAVGHHWWSLGELLPKRPDRRGWVLFSLVTKQKLPLDGSSNTRYQNVIQHDMTRQASAGRRPQNTTQKTGQTRWRDKCFTAETLCFFCWFTKQSTLVLPVCD